MNKGNDQLNCETCNTFAATVENKTPSKLILKYQATILDKINGKPRPPLSPKSKMGNDFFGGGWGVWGGGGGVDGGLLFHFILSKIVSPASRRHWSLMHDGKLIRQDTSLKNQTKTIKNLHG